MDFGRIFEFPKLKDQVVLATDKAYYAIKELNKGIKDAQKSVLILG